MLHIRCKDTIKKWFFDNVLYIPGIASNLISVYNLTFDNISANFPVDRTVDVFKYDKLVATGYFTKTGLYCLSVEEKNGNIENYVCNEVCSNENNVNVVNVCIDQRKEKRGHCQAVMSDIRTWHRRLGHLNADYLIKLRNDAATGVAFKESKLDECDVCVLGKYARKPFTKSQSRAKGILELIHSDVCYIGDVSLGGAKYFVTFVDDHSRMLFLYFVRQKSQVFDVFQDFKALIENQTGRKIKVLRTDNEREYLSEDFLIFLSRAGIAQQYSCPETPQQNGRAETVNRRIQDRIRCMLLDSGLGRHFWAETALMAAGIINCTPRRCLNNVTPYEVWHGQRPDLSNLRIFGSRCLVHIVHKHPKNKLLKRCKECLMIGLSQKHKAYRLYDLEKKRIFYSRDVVVRENSEDVYAVLPLYEGQITNDEPEEEDFSDKDSDTSEKSKCDSDSAVEDVRAEQRSGSSPDKTDLSQNSQKPKRPQRKRKLPVCLQECHLYIAGTKELIFGDPKNYNEAMKSPEASVWKQAMQREYDSCMENETWFLVEPPAGCNVIGSSWVLKRKTGIDGKMEYKARIFANGNMQSRGYDFHETYSPVVRMTTLWILFALTAKYKFHMRHFDVSSAYLHRKEDVYMRQPKDFEQGSQTTVC